MTKIITSFVYPPIHAWLCIRNTGGAIPMIYIAIILLAIATVIAVVAWAIIIDDPDDGNHYWGEP